MIPLIEAALVAVVVASYLDQRRERTAQKLAAQQEARLGEALEERISLRSALVAARRKTLAFAIAATEPRAMSEQEGGAA